MSFVWNKTIKYIYPRKTQYLLRIDNQPIFSTNKYSKAEKMFESYYYHGDFQKIELIEYKYKIDSFDIIKKIEIK